MDAQADGGGRTYGGAWAAIMMFLCVERGRLGRGRAMHAKRVQFSHVRVLSDSRNEQKSVTQIIYLGPLPTGRGPRGSKQ